MPYQILDTSGLPITDTAGRNCGFGWQNAILTGTLAASSQIANLPVTNLATDQGAASCAWRAATSATLTVRVASPIAWGAVSLHRTNLTAAATWSVAISRGGASVWSSGTVGASVTNGQCALLPPGSPVGDTLTIAFSDPTNPDGYASIPLAYAGPLWQPVRNASWQGSEGTDSGVDEVTSLSGVEYPRFRWSRRRVVADFQSLGTLELPVLRAINLLGQTGRNVLFVPDPGSSTLPNDLVFGRLSGADITNPAGGADRRATRFTLTERL